MADKFRINGQEREFDEGQVPKTLSELLEKLEIKEATVVAEIDGKIVERIKFGETEIRPGESIELVRFVGGG